MKPPADLWTMVVEQGLQDVFPPQCISFAMNAYARAINVCSMRGYSFRSIRVDVIGRLLSLHFSFNGENWEFYRKDSKLTDGTPMVGRCFLELENETINPMIPLEEVIFTGEGERYMLVKNKYYMGYMKADGTWKVESGEDLFPLAERFKQVVTNVRPPPKEVRLYMDARHPDGTAYQHDIAKFTR